MLFRSTFICCNNQIRIITIIPHHLCRGHNFTIHDVIRYIEQAAQIILVASHAFRHKGITTTFFRRTLDDEAAFRAHWHDDGVLDLLGFDEPQNFGAEILRPVGPADAAARNLAAAQMNGLGARGIDEDLDQRSRQRQFLDAAGIELEGDIFLRAPIGRRLVEIGAQRRQNQREELADDTVFREVGDGFKRCLNARFQLGGSSFAPFALASATCASSTSSVSPSVVPERSSRPLPE